MPHRGVPRRAGTAPDPRRLVRLPPGVRVTSAVPGTPVSKGLCDCCGGPCCLAGYCVKAVVVSATGGFAGLAGQSAQVFLTGPAAASDALELTGAFGGTNPGTARFQVGAVSCLVDGTSLTYTVRSRQECTSGGASSWDSITNIVANRLCGGAVAYTYTSTLLADLPTDHCFRGQLVVDVEITRGACLEDDPEDPGGGGEGGVEAAARPTAAPCRHRPDDPSPALPVVAAGLDPRRGWYVCGKAGFGRYGLLVTGCRDAGVDTERRCGPGCPGYEPAG